MPELDYALLCDYARVERGLAHIIGAGIDTIHAVNVPTGHNLTLLMRLTFTKGETGRPHRVEVFFRDVDGRDIAKIEGAVTAEWNEVLPPHWKVGALLALNVALPLTAYGEYSFEILIGDHHVKTLNLRVVGPEEPGGA